MSQAITAVAIICARNEEIHIKRCLRDLIADGIDVILIDHDSADATVEKAKWFLGRGLLSIERLEWTGEFSLSKQLEAKRRIIIDQAPHDWVIHVDADEWLATPQDGQTLLEGIGAADAAGANAINFEEFVFVPRAGEDFYYEWYSWIMNSYYLFEPSHPRFGPGHPRLMRAWRRQAGLDNRPHGGHALAGDGLQLHPVNFVLRHYIVLGLDHARAKYLNRSFAQEDIDRGWYGRLEITEANLKLPPKERLSELPYPGSKGFSKAAPMRGHFWQW